MKRRARAMQWTNKPPAIAAASAGGAESASVMPAQESDVKVRSLSSASLSVLLVWRRRLTSIVAAVFVVCFCVAGWLVERAVQSG